MRAVCGCGGIGRHNRLKICRLNGRAGSIPATRTITLKRRPFGAALFYWVNGLCYFAWSVGLDMGLGF